MNFILSTIRSVKTGWYSGRGFKAHQNNQHEKAVHYYDLALQFLEDDFEPVIYEAKAMALYELKKFSEALFNAQKSFEQYSSLNSKDPKDVENLKKLKALIEYLERN